MPLLENKVLNKITDFNTFEEYLQHLKTLVMDYGLRFLVALLLLTVGLWVIRLLIRGLNRLMLARDVDPTLRPFLKSIISIGLKVLLFLSIASMLGIETTSFVAALGAAGLAIGLALQGSLSNFAGGVLILFFKPFRVGDVIQAQGQQGTVREIQILYTLLTTADNKIVVIPNGNLSNNEIVNFTALDTRRLELLFNIGYGNDLLKAKNILQSLVVKHDLILPEPLPLAAVHELTDSGVKMICRVWAKRENIELIQHWLYENIKLEFDREGIYMPVPEFMDGLVSIVPKSSLAKK
jgi:small conductance mechanosensitive channel